MEVSCSGTAGTVSKDEQSAASCASTESGSTVSSLSAGNSTRSSSRRKSSMKQTKTSNDKDAKLRSLNNVKFEPDNSLSEHNSDSQSNHQLNGESNSSSIDESLLTNVKDENRPIQAIRQSTRNRPGTPKPVVNKSKLKLENVTGSLENQQTVKAGSPKKLVNGRGRNNNNNTNKVFCPNDENTMDGLNTKTNGHKQEAPNAPTQFNLNIKAEESKSESDVKMATSDQASTPSTCDVNVVDEESSSRLTADPESNTLNGGDESQTGSTTGEKIKKQRKKRASNYGLFNQIESFSGTVETMFVYRWPQGEDADSLGEAPDTYILQEQVSEYLGVKSFKRKYPDIFRRLLDIKERVYLQENNVVTETQCDLGLTALRLNDCLDIMAESYPEKFKELNDYLIVKARKEQAAAIAASAEANANEMAEPVKTGRFGRVILSEAERMKEAMKKAMKSATAYNANLQREKRSERAGYFDLQTMRIQKMRPNIKYSTESTNPHGQYPVALLQGQYQYHYKKYTTDELKQIPINTVIYQAEVPVAIQYEEWKMREANPNRQRRVFNKHDNGSDGENERMETAYHHQKSMTSAGEVHYNQAASSMVVSSSHINSAGSNEYVSHAKGKMTVGAHLLANNGANKPQASPVMQSQQSSPAVQPQPSNFRISCSAAPTVASLIQQKAAGSNLAQSSPASATVKVNISSMIKQEAAIIKPCYVCLRTSPISTPGAIETVNVDQFMVHCSACDRYAHPTCLELNPDLVRWPAILEYNWQCMDCKKCSGCQKPHDEDKMMFCDRCDRGFHTYCVGLKEVPSDAWFCPKCPQHENSGVSTIKSELASVSRTDDSSHAVRSAQLNTPKQALDKVKAKERGSGSGKRGRPLGSLNKPKDPNSPTKKLKQKLKVGQGLNYSGYGDLSSSMHENSNTNGPASVDDSSFLHDDQSQSLSYDNYTNIINNTINLNNSQSIQSTL